MHIEIDTQTVSQLELQALSALIDVLSGRTTTVNVQPITVTDIRPLRQPGDDDTTLQPVDRSDEDADVVNAAGAPTVDSAGLPWDERIHAASRATIADGTWRRRKNTPDATYDAVMAELRAAHGATVRPTEPALAAVEQTSATPAPSTDDTPPPPVESAATAPAADAATSATDVPPPPPASDGPTFKTFGEFVMAVNGKDVPAEKKTYGALNELCAAFGVAAFKDMKDRAADWPLFYDMVG